MDFSIIDLKALDEQLIAFRRERHMYPENGWTEFLTTSVLVKHLQALGFECIMGKEIHMSGDRYGVPGDAQLAKCMERAIAEGADPELVEKMRGGYTGVVGILDTGRPGPFTAMRADIDCVDVEECHEDTHFPCQAGFDSRHPKLAHACGHDFHTSIGLGVATVLAACREQLCGKFMIVFQPAEEGVRGGTSVAQSGILNGVDYLFGGHVTSGLPVGKYSAGSWGMASTYKVDMIFKGLGAHAGASPEAGHNAAAAAANAILNCLAISRNSKGGTRVNVGSGEFGPGRNVVPDYAILRAEVRGDTNELNEYMFERMLRVARGSADMYECDFSYQIVGHSIDCPSDPELRSLVADCAKEVEEITEVRDYVKVSGAAEDGTFLMEAVQRGGGKATYLQVGCDGKYPHHNPRFDINEACILPTVKLYCTMVGKLNARG